MSSDGGGKSKRQEDDEKLIGANFSDGDINKKNIDAIQKKKIQNNIRCQRYRDKKKNEAMNLISKNQTITIEEQEKIKRRQEQNKQNSQRYRDKKRNTNLINLQTNQNTVVKDVTKCQNLYNTQIAGPSTINMLYVQPTHTASLSIQNEPYVPESHSNYDDVFRIYPDSEQQIVHLEKMSRTRQSSSNDHSMGKNQDDPNDTSLQNTNSDLDDSVVEVVLTFKGSPKLIHNDYMYTIRKKNHDQIRWRCVRRKTNCRGSLLTTNIYTNPELLTKHNHKPDTTAAQQARIRYKELHKPYISMMSLKEGKANQTLDETEPVKILLKQNDEIDKCENQADYQRLERRTSQRSRLVLVAGNTDTTKLTSHKIIQEQKSSGRGGSSDNNSGGGGGGGGGGGVANISSNDELVESVRKLEGIAMKQEPEDEEDCYLEDNGMPVVSPTSSPRSSAASRHTNTTTHRVRSHARSLRAMANPSAVWAHFDLCANDPLRAQCRICGAVVVRGGANPRQCGTTNLHRHLRVHHGGRLIGRSYHVLQSNTPASQSNATTTKTIRITTPSFMRPHIRNIAPAPSPQQQQQRQPKTLVLKTIPLKVKQVAPTTIKMPPRQTPQGVPQNIVHQQPTEVCLRWNSYHSNMQNSFPSLLDSEQFVDVTLACEGRSLKCHKMILSSCSDYLADLLRENPCQHPIILMKDLKFWEVEALVKFMYRGEVNVAHDKLPQLLNAAEALQVKGLAGPSPSSQNSKPPMLIPQTKTISQLVVPHIVTETKENKPSTSGVPTLSSPKRAQKRQQSEPPEPRPFTKIRLQRPTTPSSPLTTVKTEPLDIPLSPTEIFPESNEDNSNPVNFEKLISFHEEDDPGGDDLNDETREINFCEIPGPPDLNDCEDQMEFVPTDFLEQEQDIVEESEPSCNKDDKDDLTDHSSVDVGEGDDERDGEEEEEPCSKEDDKAE
ncbi:hypothetical protein M0802_002769 [Mischocyttarus mexicanus]|nr:hypothetical protein M0802_002769 [Mischocyttarus mexicanus]